MQFSLFYFGAEGTVGIDGTRVLIEGAKIADECGLHAVWTPERHFDDFGGPFPNPAVTGAALAMLTERVRIRAGSVVLPLHDPIRVAEEWSVVDNLSNGRVDVSFASGWHTNDFVLAPNTYDTRRAAMLEGIDTIQRLWRGESIDRINGVGEPTSVALYPRPVQAALPMWITSGGNPETFELAGELGAGVLTHMLGQDPAVLGDNIARYREMYEKSRAEHGQAGNGHVSLMLHTYLGDDTDRVRDRVRVPLCNYLHRFIELSARVTDKAAPGTRMSDASADDMRFLVDRAFDRYFDRDGLFGTPASTVERVAALGDIGVDEIACLVDFGVADDHLLDGLPHLAELNAIA